MDDNSVELIGEFTKGDNSITFYSVDSELRFGEELQPRKHKLVTDLVLADNNEVGDTTVDHQNDAIEPIEEVQVEPGKVSDRNVRSNKRSGKERNTKRTSSSKEGTSKKKQRITKKRECRPRGQALIDDLKEFSESLLQDLEVESKNILAKFTEDLKNLGDANSVEKDKHRPRTGQSQQQNSTASEPQPEQQSNKSLRNSNQPPGLPVKSSSVSCGRHKSGTNTINHQHVISNFQPVVQYSDFTQMETTPVYVYPSGIRTSSMGSGFPLSIHQRMNTPNILSQIVTDSSSGSNAIGRRINGGPTGSSVSSHLLSGNVAATNFRTSAPSREIGTLHRMPDPRFGNP